MPNNRNTPTTLLFRALLLLWLCATSAAVHSETQQDTIQWKQYDTHDEANAVVKEQSRRIKDNPDQAAPYIIRGNAYFELRDSQSAADDFSQAIKIDDKADLAWFGRGMALGRLGAIDEAIKDLSVYIARHPESSLAHTKRGIRHLWNKDSANAEKDLAKAIELDPRNAEAHDDLGVIKAQRGEYDKAVQHFATTVSIDPTYQKGFHNLALVYYITEHSGAALASVDTALDLSPNNRNTLLLKANILKSLGRDAEAVEAFETAEFLPEGGWSEQVPVQ